MTLIEQIQQGINYIEDHLDVDIALADVAGAGGISQWHFQRIFKALTGETLKTYIRSRRLAGALDKLRDPNARIIDIAMDAGYESQESFTRAFKKAYGMTPNVYRKIGEKSLFLKKVQIDIEYIRHINSNLSLQPEIHQQASMQLVGLKTCFYSVDSEKNNIAETLPPLWEAFINRLDQIEFTVPGVCYGVVQSNPQTELLEYHAAIEVSQWKSLPEGMVGLVIPAATYAKFTHRGDVKQINNTVNYIYSSWLLQSDMLHTYDADLEIYTGDYHPTSDQSVMYYAIPVQAGAP